MLDHVINGFAHALLHGVWLQYHLGFPDLPTSLAKLVGREGTIRFCPCFTANTRVIRSTSIFHLAQVFLFELSQSFGTQGIAIGVIACCDEGIVDSFDYGTENTERTFGKRRGPGR